MKLSTRFRYGVRLMSYLAQNYGRGPILLKDIAKKEDISGKYLSLIIIPLRTAGLVQSTRGAHGGYVLARDPSRINVREIFDVLEGGTCIVDCVRNPSRCTRVSTCPTRDIWAVLGRRIEETLESITLASLVKPNQDKAENVNTSNK